MGRPKLGVALAGGGFRASLFHVGVLRRMAEMDLLRHVEVLSTVSGGSIVGALYLLLLKERLEDASNDGLGPHEVRLTQGSYQAIVDELQGTLVRGVQRNLRTRLLFNPYLLLRVMLTRETLGTAMARLYERQFFADVVRRLRPPPPEPAQVPPTCPSPGPEMLVNVTLISETRDTATAQLHVRQHVSTVVKTVRTSASKPASALQPCLPHTPDHPPQRAGSISIRALRLRRTEVWLAGGSEDYNRVALDPVHDRGRGGPGSAVTRLIVNATSLNSGARFWFSHAEMGDWYFGHIRYDEIDAVLLPIKVLLELREPVLTRLDQELMAVSGEAAERRWLQAVAQVLEAWRLPKEGTELPPQVSIPSTGQRVLVRWWKTPRDKAPVDLHRNDIPWNVLHVKGFDLARFSRHLADAEAGRLRHVKAFAWYLQVGRHRSPPVNAGFADAELYSRFWDALESIDERAAQALRRGVDTVGSQVLWAPHLHQRVLSGMWQLIIDMFNLRMAQLMSPRCKSEWDRMPLSHAVTASAAFPPMFPPFLIGELFDDLQVRVLGLTDGGVFDNLGTTALLDEQCNFIIASDPGGVFEDRLQRSSVGRAGLTARLSEILGERPSMLYRHDLRERRRLGRAVDDRMRLPDTAERHVTSRALRALALFRIDSERLEPHPPSPVWRSDLARLRTDLDTFGDVEIKALINEGYLMADQYLRAELAGTHLDPAVRTPGTRTWPAAAEPPLAMHRTQEDVQSVLVAGRARFLRALVLHAPLSVASVLVVLGAIVVSAWLWPVSWEDLNKWVVNTGTTWLPKLLATIVGWIPPLTLIPIVDAITPPWLVTIVAIGVLCWVGLKGPVRRKLAAMLRKEDIPRQWLRKWAAVVKWFRLLRGWTFLLLVPVLAVFVSIVAVLADVFFARPFLRRTSDPEGLHPGRPPTDRRP